MAAPPLPTPRALVTALLDTLALVPAGGGEGEEAAAVTTTTTTTTTTTPPRLPPAARPLLTTLHTLYPRLLLPALDLLDRRLVLRVIVGAATGSSSSSGGGGGSGHVPYYRVRSAQVPTRPRGGRRGASAADPLVYVVRTGAWSCSCAPFALSAFPVEPAPAPPAYAICGADPRPDGRNDVAVDDHEGVAAAAAAAADREFGGRSRDGRPPSAGGVGPGDVPCCKHLLACVLAERWDVLGPYVEERRVEPEEAVGLMAGS